MVKSYLINFASLFENLGGHSFMIEYRNVGMVYGKNEILSQIDLTINEGEFFVLVGPSGSGKTTLLRMLNQLTRPTSGDIYLNGKKIKDHEMQKLRLSMGYVLQESSLFPNLTLEDNIAIQLEQLGVAKAKRRKRAQELLDLVELPAAQYAKRYPRDISGGQKQRVALVRALAADPKLILMDESFSALDPVLRQQMQTLILKLWQKFKMTVVFVTHDMQEALRLGQRIAVLDEGKIKQVGTPQEILTAPADQFVRDFFRQSPKKALPLKELIVTLGLVPKPYDKKYPQLTAVVEVLSYLRKQPSLNFNYQETTYTLTRDQLFQYLESVGI